MYARLEHPALRLHCRVAQGGPATFDGTTCPFAGVLSAWAILFTRIRFGKLDDDGDTCGRGAFSSYPVFRRVQPPDSFTVGRYYLKSQIANKEGILDRKIRFDWRHDRRDIAGNASSLSDLNRIVAAFI